MEEDYHRRLEENRKKAEERTAKKRLKRLKKQKSKKNVKKNKLSQENVKTESTTEESEDECSESKSMEYLQKYSHLNENDEKVPMQNENTLDDRVEEQKPAFVETINSSPSKTETDNCDSHHNEHVFKEKGNN